MTKPPNIVQDFIRSRKNTSVATKSAMGGPRGKYSQPKIPIFTPMSELARLSGVGPKREKLFGEAGIGTLRALVYHLPRRYIDRTKVSKISDLEVGKDCIFSAKVVSLAIIQTRMVVEVEDETGSV